MPFAQRLAPMRVSIAISKWKYRLKRPTLKSGPSRTYSTSVTAWCPWRTVYEMPPHTGPQPTSGAVRRARKVRIMSGVPARRDTVGAPERSRSEPRPLSEPVAIVRAAERVDVARKSNIEDINRENARSK